MDNAKHYRRMSEAHNPYGDGNACQRILGALTVNRDKSIAVEHSKNEASEQTIPEVVVNAI